MTETQSGRVSILEVGPRDGLQNEPTPIDTATKLAFIEALAASGLGRIEATAFVHPHAVPQLADAAAVARGLPVDDSIEYSALVPNRTGLRRAIDAGVRRVAVFTAASETFARRNINMSIAESLAEFERVVADATGQGLTVRGYLSTCFVCPYEGEIAPDRVRAVATRLMDLGVDEIAISDTIGAAVPTDIVACLGEVLQDVPVERVALHLHDTYGTALANVCAALPLGITRFDASAGGLGGCPYAPGAAGNLATEDLVYLLERMGIATGVSLEGVFRASTIVANALGRRLPGKQYNRLRAAGGDAEPPA
ncbi:MAG: hydroxymethylglutaryl-CoA lyase [Phycisphaerales bacterium]|nr:hydroxymethylglutaryl-CoA lyase [Phycisphaerales bacterium]